MSRKYSESGRSVFQCPEARPYAYAPNRSAPIPRATAQYGTDLPRGAERIRAPCEGQEAMHSRHPVHSADWMVMSLSTASEEGQAFEHFAQSMQRSELRRMRSGLASETRPISAPYGQKYRHQKF